MSLCLTPGKSTFDKVCSGEPPGPPDTPGKPLLTTGLVSAGPASVPIVNKTSVD